MKAPEIIPIVIEHPGITSEEFAEITGQGMKHSSQDLYRCRRAGYLRRKKGRSQGVGRPPCQYFVKEKGREFLHWYTYPCMLPDIQDPHNLLSASLKDTLYSMYSLFTHQDTPELRAIIDKLILENVELPFRITLYDRIRNGKKIEDRFGNVLVDVKIERPENEVPEPEFIYDGGSPMEYPTLYSEIKRMKKAELPLNRVLLSFQTMCTMLKISYSDRYRILYRLLQYGYLPPKS